MAKSRKPKRKVTIEDVVSAIMANLTSIVQDAGDNEKIFARIKKLAVTSGKIATAARTADERDAKRKAREEKKAERKAARKEKLQAQLEATKAKLKALEN